MMRRPGYFGLSVLLLALAWAGLHLVNLWRLDTAGLDEGLRNLEQRLVSVRDRARPEYQEYALATLPPNPLAGPASRLDLELAEAEALEDPGSPVDKSAAMIHAFEFEGEDRPGLEAAGLESELRDGKLVITASADGYLWTDGLAIPRDDVGQIVIRMRADKGTSFRLGWTGEGEAPPAKSIWRHRFELRLRNLGAFETYVIDARNILKRGLQPGEKLTRLYLSPSDAPGARVEIDYIRFVGKTARYLAAPRGRIDETVAGEIRPVLYMWPNQRLAFELELPQRAPRFDFGAAVVRNERPVRFEVRLTDAEGAATVLYDRTVATPDTWQDARVDLTPWAGQKIRLELAAIGSSENVALWADPTVWGGPPRPLRVIWILEDAERAESLSVYGRERATTPFKERLAERAIVFTRAFAQATKTRPSVASYMTGLYPSATGLWHFADVLSERHLTIAEILRAQGFATAAFIQNGNVGPYAGLHQGFGSLLDETQMGKRAEDVLLGERVWKWIEQRRDRNFFLYLHVLDPHAPYDPPADYRNEEMDRGTAVSRDPVFDPEWVAQPTMEGRKARYEAEIRHNDSVLDRFFARLGESGLAEDTLVILTADHGEYMGERGLLGNRLWDHHPPSYTQVTAVPLMFVYPARFPEAKRIDAPVQLVDLAPTILELAGVPRDDLLLQGESLVPLIDGVDPDSWNRRVVLVEEPTAMERSDPCACGSLISRDWQILGSPWAFKRSWLYFPRLTTWLLTHAYRVDDAVRPELDLASLPDLRLRWYHRRWIARLRDPGIETWERITGGVEGGRLLDPATLERLKGLGYVN